MSNFSIDLLYIFVVGVVIAGAISLIYWTIRTGISPLPSSYKVKELIISLVKDLAIGIENEDDGIDKHSENPTGLARPGPVRPYTIIESGSGWGTLTVPLARLLPKWLICGYESSPVPYWFSKLYVWWSGCANLSMNKKDFSATNFSSAKIIVCYLFPKGMKTIKKKVLKECQGNSLYIISNTFSVPGWEPEKIVTAENIYRTKIYLYNLNSQNS